MTFFETFGPEYVRPANPDCPDCDCCTAALCERGRTHPLGCRTNADPELEKRLAECPCSNAPGTLCGDTDAAWEALRRGDIDEAGFDRLGAEILQRYGYTEAAERKRELIRQRHGSP